MSEDEPSSSSTRTATNEVHIGVFADAPLPGHCLPKLLTAYTPEWVAGLYASMLRDTLDGLQSIDASEYLVFSSADEETTTALARHVPAPWRIVTAIDDAAAAFARLHSDRAVAILARTDAPSAVIDPLVDLAERGSLPYALLGAAQEGAAWLVGIAGADALLSRDLPWASLELAATMRVRCTRAGIDLHELPQATVADEPSAVLALFEELRRHPERAPRTAHYIATRG